MHVASFAAGHDDRGQVFVLRLKKGKPLTFFSFHSDTEPFGLP